MLCFSILHKRRSSFCDASSLCFLLKSKHIIFLITSTANLYFPIPQFYLKPQNPTDFESSTQPNGPSVQILVQIYVWISITLRLRSLPLSLNKAKLQYLHHNSNTKTCLTIYSYSWKCISQKFQNCKSNYSKFH